MKKEVTKFGLGQLENKTPTWAKNVFRVTLIVTCALSIYVAASTIIPVHIKVETLLIFKLLDGLVLGLSKLVGVEIQEK